MANFAASRILHSPRDIRSRFFPFLFQAKKGYSSSRPVTLLHLSLQRRGSSSPEGFSTSTPPQSSKAPMPSDLLAKTAFHLHASNPNEPRVVLSDSPTKVDPSYFSKQIRESSGFEEISEPARHLLDNDDSKNCELDAMSDRDECRNTRQEVEEVAVSLLASRAFTAIELRRKLQGKKYQLHIVESIVDDFKSRGLLNDGLYAESFTRSRWFSSTWGPRRIKHALLQKGVSDTEAESARKHVFEDDDPEGDGQNVKHGMCRHALDRLFLQASKQWLRSQDTCPDNRRVRIVRWLQYRGFNWGVTYYILKKLESQYPMKA